MVSSMTAFARQEYRGELGVMSWEIRSVNHRYLEMHLRLPEELRVLESGVRERIAAKLGRGKLDCSLKFVPGKTAAADLQVNSRLLSQLLAAGDEIASVMGGAATIQVMDLLRWPGVLEEQERDFAPIAQQAMELLEQTLDSLQQARQREGARLAETVMQRRHAMQDQVAQVRELMPKVLQSVRQKIRQRLEEVMAELDEARLEQEMALLAQRLDVDEEMDRLDTHLQELEWIISEVSEPVGRRLDFLMQELNREANTLTSKSNDVEVTRIAVEMKVLIEQMREQTQNIE
ncbi:YicC/YloC family endoribonuclease [endosymbiont of Ridgeia piscesae]|jgi:uncharacterized protein (TIGR00255 family)|uniref:TIGR00255 family protein n=1 Tax=endosymbiont of Ridgeia piscesae TaxID=54398 RepID=A0A0T5YTL5_9GAMM|nr:YicC/YloC family endoribonuclease [endosymbiont of Ridgeia piscesae]KRT53868.1 TIGR00255 family protein [endosymbiont of Ridgeia piscesae]KRT58079.1 TIGR00255 family protein [endosymbiont of Ridgeia piscesae]